MMAKGYQETRCMSAIDALYLCCHRMQLEGGISTACPKPEVVARKLREIEERKGEKKK